MINISTIGDQRLLATLAALGAERRQQQDVAQAELEADVMRTQLDALNQRLAPLFDELHASGLLGWVEPLRLDLADDKPLSYYRLPFPLYDDDTHGSACYGIEVDAFAFFVADNIARTKGVALTIGGRRLWWDGIPESMVQLGLWIDRGTPTQATNLTATAEQLRLADDIDKQLRLTHRAAFIGSQDKYPLALRIAVDLYKRTNRLDPFKECLRLAYVFIAIYESGDFRPDH